MATTVIRDTANHPHLLKLVGDVINNDAALTLNRSEVLTALFSGASPFGDLTGKVDFVICFNRNGGSPNWNFEDHSTAFSPRPLRGIVQIHNINLSNDSQLDRMGPLLSLLIHEIGHYWIRGNAGEAKIRADAATVVDTPTANQIADALNDGRDYPMYPMIGRQDSHWSPFLDGVNSPFEAGKFGQEIETDGIGFFGLKGRFTQVEGQTKVGPEFFLPGSDGGTVTTKAAYSLFERWLMGDYIPPKRAAVGTLWPTFRVIEPVWAFPLPFQAGLFVELSSGERLYAGYNQGPQSLGVYQTDGGYIGSLLSLPVDPYRPHEVVGLRVVQVGNVVRFQARVWPIRSGCLGPGLGWLYRFKPDPSCDSVLEDLKDNLADPGTGSPDHYYGWRTIGTKAGMIGRLGLSSRSLQTGTSEGNRQYGAAYARVYARLCLLNQGNIQKITTHQLTEDIPKAGPRRLSNGRLVMPYRVPGEVIGNYPEDELVQQAPKWVVDAPNGDFAFGGCVTLESCAMVSWAGGLQSGKKLVGRMRRVKFNDFLLPSDIVRARRKEEPHNGFYKVLFCAAARNNADITDLQLTQLDRIRRAFEIYFSLVTSRAINTLID